ncbi:MULTISPECIES: CPCC family cysteine-rich protein [Marinobacter]|mgnify:FL=1|uniref:CPCC family cysteine-rich protein n=2 Tax=Marinobacteraceae TaxID=2887365 RepID=UPI000C9537E4|nr:MULTISPECIES: CPCC family cysteine-rich protein [unclassified Marinobacter]MAC24713.1 hypothetical protein [Marinobacter sp.]MEC9041344.1 CPCC family cysteine-rich protein [Pseudomonadota bacterium]MEC9387854.1 CPCC family cysteine-rich protein [Pseudomonadota bacterium]HCL37017.1 hypothetical protein [Marinobacter nauticus]
MRYTCRCCGYKTLDEPSGGTYEICELCGWEDDGVQSSDPDYVGGANGMSLREAQHAFLAETPESKDYQKDESWQLLEAPTNSGQLKRDKVDFVVDPRGNVKDA